MKHAISALFGFMAAILSLIAAKAILLSLIALSSVAVTITSFSIPALANLAHAAATRLPFVRPAVLSPAESKEIRQENRRLQTQNAALTDTNRQLSHANQSLGHQNHRLQDQNTRLSGYNRELIEKNHQLTATNRNLESQTAKQRGVVAKNAERIKTRSAHLAARSIGAIPAESIPVLGVATIIATTTWDLSDACKTIRDMSEIQSSVGVEPDESGAEWVCDKLSLQGARSNQYRDMTESQCRQEAKNARDVVLDLARSSRDEIPDLILDPNEFDTEIMQVAQKEFDEINTICDCIADLACKLGDLMAR